MGLNEVGRIEHSTRYLLHLVSREKGDGDNEKVTENHALIQSLVDCLHDRMTECRYLKPLSSFELQVEQEQTVFDVDIMGGGKDALLKANKDLGIKLEL